jgi:hypothetical protein
VVIGFAAGDIPMLKINYPLLKNIEVMDCRSATIARSAR